MKPYDHNRGKRYRSRSNNKTGVVGVHHTRDKRPKWVASWVETIDGKRKPQLKNFYYKRGGKAEAFEKAVKHRKQMEKLHYTGAM